MIVDERRHEINQLKEQIQHLSEDKQKLVDWVEAKKKEYSEWEANRQKQHETLQAEISHAEKAKKELDAKVSELYAKNEETVRNLQSLNIETSKNQSLLDQIGQKTLILEKKEQDILNLESRIDKKSKALNSAFEKIEEIRKGM